MSSVLDLYILQLKSLLPRNQRDDVAAEIGENIASAVEERKRDLGRELSNDEMRTLLKAYGHPIVIAGRYLPIQQLIGPSVFPLYWYAIQAVLMVIATIGGIVATIALLSEPRGTQAALQVLGRFFWVALDAGALVTLLFALLERQRVHFPFLEDFDPRKLGTGLLARGSAALGEIPRGDTVLELTTVAILLLWWTGWLVFPSVVASVKVELGSGIETLYFPVAALCIADLIRLGADFTHPYRTRARISIAIGLNAAWLVLLVVAFSSGHLVQVAPSIEEPAEIARVALIADRVFRLVLLALGIWTAMLLAADVVRLLRRR